jgi:hypothetical protein
MQFLRQIGVATDCGCGRVQPIAAVDQNPVLDPSNGLTTRPPRHADPDRDPLNYQNPSAVKSQAVLD